MSVPTPSPAVRPARLGLLTTPLLIALIYNAISLLTLPFSGPTIRQVLADLSAATGEPALQISEAQIQTVLWLSFALTSALVLWLYFTRRAVLEGRRWGWVSTLVIAVLSLLVLPFGTVLGLIMLFGLFDREVQAYLRR
ncbi:signal transduction histidine kinase [Deinococcus sp. HSC-46F16]|uniref:hypothetical protein n=1 Tax=Deinococcus sp. HSC-46F16 TaxID=2910968 RepID=UPI0020A0E619|nr:hypothetical protein [Deinococcus sp. HSC-46F16]MCP2014722.1 signal transduction histidine kinase [Deinococcus sp. HSC-46F16]